MSKTTCEKGHKISCSVCRRIERYRTDPAYRTAELTEMKRRYARRKARLAAAKLST